MDGDSAQGVQITQDFASWPNGKGRFLRALFGSAGNVSEACEASNTVRETVYHWRRTVPGFREAMDTAREQARDQLVQDAIDYAHGAFRPGAELTGEGMRAALRLLSNAEARHWAERSKSELTGADGGPIQITGVERVIVNG